MRGTESFSLGHKNRWLVIIIIHMCGHDVSEPTEYYNELYHGQQTQYKDKHPVFYLYTLTYKVLYNNAHNMHSSDTENRSQQMSYLLRNE